MMRRLRAGGSGGSGRGRFWLGVVLLACAACTTGARRDADAPQPASSGRMPSTASPVSDFRIGRDELPDVLLRAVADPYRRPLPADCAGLAAEIESLDAVLGPDLDTLADADKTEGAADMFASAMRSLIPYHGVIRFLTGARQRERRAAAAIAAGEVRRAYLKGLGEQLACAVPASPLRSPPATGPGAPPP